MLQFIYSQLIRLILPFILLRLWWNGRRAPDLRRNWYQRLGIVPRASGTVVWVHAVSVGETIALRQWCDVCWSGTRVSLS